MVGTPTYDATRDRVEAYFDDTATKTWERLTSDAPVSGIRRTVRAGRDRMRDIMLSRLPDDLSGRRVLDAGCGTGAMTEILAQRVSQSIVFTVAPRTPFLMTFFTVGKLFPRADRSPTMIPHAPVRIHKETALAGATGTVSEAERVTSGFYISTCLEYAQESGA